MVAYVYAQHDLPYVVGQAARHNILEFAELMLFLLVAMRKERAFNGILSWPECSTKRMLQPVMTTVNSRWPGCRAEHYRQATRHH